MSVRRATVRVPAGLGAPGKALWKSILSDLSDGWELDAREVHLLGRACRCADEIQRLEVIVDRDGLIVLGSKKQPVAHPGLQECRQLRLVQLRLLAALELEDPAVARAALSPASRRAAKAAGARWSREGRRLGAV
jgi:hypothetical protein